MMLLFGACAAMADTTSAGGDAHVSYGLSFQLVVYSRDGVVTLTDAIDANPAFGDCSEPADAVQEALREVHTPHQLARWRNMFVA